MSFAVDTFKRSLNPFKTVRESLDPRKVISREVATIGDPTGKLAASRASEQRSEAQAKEAQLRSERESKAFKEKIKARSDARTTEESEIERSRMRGVRGKKRSLLTGDERGVDIKGRRITTG